MALHSIHMESGSANPEDHTSPHSPVQCRDIIKLMRQTELNGFQPLTHVSEPSTALRQIAAIAATVSLALEEGEMPNDITRTCMEAINTLAGLATFVGEHSA